MRYGLNERDLGIITHILSVQGNVKNALIFGSRAVGANKIASDIDIALVAKNGEFSLAEIANLKAQFDESDLAYCVDLVSYNDANNALKRHIDTQGKMIFFCESHSQNFCKDSHF